MSLSTDWAYNETTILQVINFLGETLFAKCVAAEENTWLVLFKIKTTIAHKTDCKAVLGQKFLDIIKGQYGLV